MPGTNEDPPPCYKGLNLERAQKRCARQCELATRSCAKALMDHSVLSIILPTFVAIIFGILQITTEKKDVGKINVERMFLPEDKDFPAIQHFESEWFGDTWSALGSSRWASHVVFKSKNNRDVLSHDSIFEVIKLHNRVMALSPLDPADNSTVTFRDLCIKTKKNAKNGDCQIDPLIKIMMYCHLNNNPLVFRTRTNEVTGVSSPSWTYPRRRGAKHAVKSAINPRKKEVFLARSIGLLDQHFPSARTLHLAYILKEPDSQKTADQISIWLARLSEELKDYENDHFTVLVTQSEGINDHWVGLMKLRTEHIVCITVLNFALVCIYTTVLSDVIFGIYLAMCSTCSLFMVVTCTVSIHNLIYAVPHFNFVQCIIFITVAHSLFQARFIKQFVDYLKKSDSVQNETMDTDRKIFSDAYHQSLSWNFVFLIVFLVSFLPPMIPPDTLTSMEHMSVTASIGFALCFLYQSTFFPTCARFYQLMLRRGVQSIQRPKPGSMGYGMMKIQTESSEISASPQHEDKLNRKISVKNEPTKEKLFECNKCKAYVYSWVKTYYNGIVSTYVRPTTVLIYLTYISFCYVGCIHFYENISPLKLLPMTSTDFKCLKAMEDDFTPFTPRFVVMGRVIGDPWNNDVSDLLRQIHDDIMSADVVDETSSDNWFIELLSYSDNGNSLNPSFFPPPPGIEDAEMFIQPPDYGGPGLSDTNVRPQIEDWSPLWDNYTQSGSYRARVGKDILFLNKSRPTFVFRWIYQTRNLKFPETKREFVQTLQNIKESIDLNIIPEIYFYAPEFHWSANLHNFTGPAEFFCLFVFVAVIIAMVVLRMTVTVLWLLFTGTSISFGMCGLLSFYSIELDSFVFPCILFVMPFSTVLTFSNFHRFSEGKDDGRSKCVQNTLQETTSHGVFCLVTLLCNSLLLACDPSYSFRNPLCSLILLVILSTLHLFFIIPVFQTIFPPSKKIEKNEPPKKGGTKPKTKREAFQQRPHLHARRFFYDSQRAASFKSDEGDGRIEHITCL